MAVSFIGGRPGVPGEYHRPVTSHWQTLSHSVVSVNNRKEVSWKLLFKNIFMFSDVVDANILYDSFLSVKSPLGLVLYCYLNMPTMNKTYLILSYLQCVFLSQLRTPDTVHEMKI